MLDLIKYIVATFAEKKDEVEYKVEEKDDAIEVTVLLAASDMGKVIGKQGKNCQSYENACQIGYAERQQALYDRNQGEGRSLTNRSFP